MSQPTYRLLNVGEIIRVGDECYRSKNGDLRWWPVMDVSIGIKVAPLHHPIRRPLVPVTRLVAALAPFVEMHDTLAENSNMLKSGDTVWGFNFTQLYSEDFIRAADVFHELLDISPNPCPSSTDSSTSANPSSPATSSS